MVLPSHLPFHTQPPSLGFNGDENCSTDAKCARYFSIFAGWGIVIPPLHPFSLSAQVSRAVLLRPDDQVRVLALRRLAVLQVPVRQAGRRGSPRAVSRWGEEELPGQPR